MAVIVLAADVGGTKSHLGLFDASSGAPVLIREHRYATLEYPSLEGICVDFIRNSPPIAGACFGVPGVVIRGRAVPSNIPWQIVATSLVSILGGAPVRLINDLGATSYGLINLPVSEFAVLQSGGAEFAGGDVAVIAAGTGLGEAALVSENGKYHAVASEGGHSDFAPRGDEQIELLRFLAREFDHVSVERVLSGPGLHNIYRFLRARSGAGEPAWLTEQILAGDPSAAISAAALGARDPVCVRALEMFCDIYGAEAANLALKVLALGGVYLGGGIAPKILPMLQRGGFIRGFLSKGRMNEVLRHVEVRVSLNPAAALLGAAHCALAML
ncbi:MAG TPA: glucokinase [Candidatus Binataceae bacterium]